jgi:hypothetical protein
MLTAATNGAHCSRHHNSNYSKPMAGLLSAPASREAVSLSGYRPRSHTTVTLSPDERQIAKQSGMTETEYAKAKIELEARKCAGLTSDGQG